MRYVHVADSHRGESYRARSWRPQRPNSIPTVESQNYFRVGEVTAT